MTTPTPDLPDDETLGRRFRVKEGRRLSPRTSLWAADDTEAHRGAEVELFDVAGPEGSTLTGAFRARLRAFEGLEHPVLSPVVSGGMHRGAAYMATQPHHGERVGDLVGERFRERVSRREALDIADLLLEALEVLHDRGLVHGHIGPDTVTLADDGSVGLLLLASPPSEGPDGAGFRPADDVAAVARLLDAMTAGGQGADEDRDPGQDSLGEAIDALVARGTDADPRRRPGDASGYRALLRETVRSLPPVAGRHAAREETPRAERSQGVVGRRRPRRWLVLAVVAALIGGAALWALAASGGGTAEEAGATMPDLVGLSPAEAAERLVRLPVAVEAAYEDVRSDDVEAGLVAASLPPAGQELAEGAGVVLSVAAGPRTITVPEVVGSLEREARLLLEEAGFADVEVVQAPSGDLPAGTVTGSDPEQGRNVSYDSAVVLTVAEGVLVPDLVGMPEQEARDALEELGLEPRVEEAPDSDRARGEVDHHTPGAGAVVEEGAVVVLGVSPGPDREEAEEREEADSPAEGGRDGREPAAAPSARPRVEEAPRESPVAAAPCSSGTWSEGEVYPEGTRAVFEGDEYEAVWWNTDSPPSESNEWGPWRRVAEC